MAGLNKDQLSAAIVFPQVQALESEQVELANARDRFIAAPGGR